MNPFTFPGIYFDKRRIYTINAVPGTQVYGERLVKAQGKEYREWEPSRSKFAAALLNKAKILPFKEDAIILYLGASTGTTVSHLSDMLPKAFIFAADHAPTVLREMVFVAEQRKNIAPLLADANHPELYPQGIPKVDVLYMDIAQKNQVEIFIKNCNAFLKKGGVAYLCVKARSIDVTRNPRAIYKEVEVRLRAQGELIDVKELDPFQKDHAFFVLKR